MRSSGDIKGYVHCRILGLQLVAIYYADELDLSSHTVLYETVKLQGGEFEGGRSHPPLSGWVARAPLGGGPEPSGLKC